MKQQRLYIPILIAGVMIVGSILACEVPDAINRIDPDEAREVGDALAEELAFERAKVQISPEVYCPGDTLTVEWDYGEVPDHGCDGVNYSTVCYWPGASMSMIAPRLDIWFTNEISGIAFGGSRTIRPGGSDQEVAVEYNLHGVDINERFPELISASEEVDTYTARARLFGYAEDEYDNALTTIIYLQCDPITGELMWGGGQRRRLPEDTSVCMGIGNRADVFGGPYFIEADGYRQTFNDDGFNAPIDRELRGQHPNDVVIGADFEVSEQTASQFHCEPGESNPVNTSSGQVVNTPPAVSIIIEVSCYTPEGLATPERQDMCRESQGALTDIDLSIPPNAGGGGASGDNEDEKSGEEAKPGEGPYCGSACSSDADCAGLGVNPVCAGGLCYDAKECDTGSSGSGISGGSSGGNSGGSEDGAVCGNGVVESGETCDGTGNGSCNWETDVCTLSCECDPLD